MYELQLEETKVKTDHDFRTNGKSQLLRNAVRTATHLLSVYLLQVVVPCPGHIPW